MQAVSTAQQQAVRGMGPALLILMVAVVVGVGTVVVGPLVVAPIFGMLFVALIVARPEYGIALFLSTFLMTYPQALQGSGFLTINNVMGGIFLILLTYKVYLEEDWWFLRCPEIQLLAFIIVVFYLSGRLNGPDPQQLDLLGLEEHASANLRTLLSRAAFTLFFINFIRAPEHVRMIYVLALAFMVVSAFTGIRDVLAGGGAYGYRAVTGVGIIASAYNPNRLAMFSIIAIVGLWYFMYSLRFRVLRLLIFPTLIMLALTVFMTASRSGLLGLGVGVMAILYDQRAHLSTILSFGLAAAVLVLVVVQFVPERSLERLTTLPGTEAAATGEGSGSLERRQYTWEIAFELAQENPILGVGMGNWEIARFMKDPARSTAAPHSSYLLALVEGGILCLFGFFALLWRTWRNLQVSESYLKRPGAPYADLLWIVKSAKASFIVLIFFSLFADLWQLVILFWLVGLGIVIRRLVEQAALQQALAE